MFNLTKWYLDCTDELGNSAIIYWGRLQLGALDLSYASVLGIPMGAPCTEFRSILPSPGPALTRRKGVDGVHMESIALDVEGHWIPQADPIKATLLERPDGRIQWTCIAPQARVDLRVQGKKLQGVGYVERLDMTLAPWKMPFRVLRWGRAIAARRSAVWIDWEGDYPRHDLWTNGTHCEHACISDDRVQSQDFSIELDRSRVIREGPIGSTALARIPGLRSVAPASLLDSREHKWLSRAAFCGGSRDGASGWAIHERVDFGEATP